jgi:hypothetical protein
MRKFPELTLKMQVSNVNEASGSSTTLDLNFHALDGG